MSSEKQCSQCKEVKSVSEFRKDSHSSDGYRCYCKKCNRKYDRSYSKNASPEHAAYVREYNRVNGHKYRGRYKIDWSKYSETAKLWHKKNPLARKAHRIVRKSIAQGKLPNASSLKCDKCGNKAAHWHHYNGYDAGHEMDVIPLCPSCHRLEHSNWS